MSALKIGNATGWTFMHGAWKDGSDDQLIPPDGADAQYLAVIEDRAFDDFVATFRFKFRVIFGGARLLFRVQDSRRYYALDVPINGQQVRSRYFWAGMVIADGTPLQRYLQFGLVPGLCIRREYWYEARVAAKGPHLRAWINDIPVADVVDETYASGRLGLAAIAGLYVQTPHFAGLEIDAAPVKAPDWPGLEVPAPHWITPCRQTEPNGYQSYAHMVQGKSGQVTLFLTFGNPNYGEARRSVFIRSDDAGRTWHEPEPPTLQQGFGATLVQRDGTWLCIYANHPVTKALLYAYTSHDEGRSWHPPKPLDIRGEFGVWQVSGAFQPVRLHDGSIVLPVVVMLDEPPSPASNPFIACMALRSEDDGQTWSAPVLCDQSHLQPGEPITTQTPEGLSGAGRYAELGIDEVADNVLIGIGRPNRDPYMWQIQSNDGGRSWQQAAPGHFPGYCPTLTRTDSGALVATTRFPYFSARLSLDRGRTWQPPVIVDYPQWANQTAFEAEPDVVLVSYMGEIIETGKADSRIARLRVADGRLTLDH